MEKSVKEIVSFMGVLYSGNFYSPIDISMPVTRINSIINTLLLRIILTQRKLKEKAIEIFPNHIILVYEDILESEILIINEDKLNEIQSILIDQDLVYVLFTSGSTGVPKGVTINNRSIIDYIKWVSDTFKIT